jgi:chaperonin GroES
MQIVPLNDKIVVKRQVGADMTPGGLYIPEGAKETTMEATIIAVGAGRRLEDGCILPMQLKVGDRVLFNKYGGTEITLNNEELLVLREEDVLAILREDSLAPPQLTFDQLVDGLVPD